MRICLVSEFDGVLDEGMRNTAFCLARELARRHEVLHHSVRPLARLATPGWWGRLRAFRPEILHYVPGPTLKGLALLKLASLATPAAKLVVSALNPALPQSLLWLASLLRPDLALVLTDASERLFRQLGYQTAPMLVGVDSERFTPSTYEERRRLRAKYGLDERAFTVLHIGPVKRGRNVLALAELRSRLDVQTVIIASLSTRLEEQVRRQLEAAGCIVWQRYFEDVSEMYHLADCYVFPTREAGQAVELPLSVLEAMACNLPVVTTRYGSLSETFAEGDGLAFADSNEHLIALVAGIKVNEATVRTRQQVLGHSWASVAAVVEHSYRELLPAGLEEHV